MSCKTEIRKKTVYTKLLKQFFLFAQAFLIKLISFEFAENGWKVGKKSGTSFQ